ncbi:MAG: helix-turn-helix domain-containing protein, partial [Actinobacteria bacterium]|nr:helix-turn-helix domain-containing protein [Actinomycetota bacterium]
MIEPGGEPGEAYRRADQRLRLLLFGDGTETPGRVRGEESRQQVSAELRRMRNAFQAVAFDSDEGRTDHGEPRAAGLEEELQRIASLRSRTQRMQRDAIPELVTPAEAAQALRLSVGTIYREVRHGEIRAVRLNDKKRGALRIPMSELERLLEA